MAGVDEAGRGALAGPLVVAAVILPAEGIPGLDDSKKLSPEKRALLAAKIRACAVAFAVVHADAAEVDRLNVLEATRQAMEEAVLRLDPAPCCVVSDAVALPTLPMPVVAEPKADGRYLCVAAASILAKVARDAVMAELHALCPQYGWASNKGYPTPEHRQALARYGPTPWHRRSYAPVRVVTSQMER